MLPIGASWPTTLAFYFANFLTIKKCSQATEINASFIDVVKSLENNLCSNESESKVRFLAFRIEDFVNH